MKVPRSIVQGYKNIVEMYESENFCAICIGYVPFTSYMYQVYYEVMYVSVPGEA